MNNFQEEKIKFEDNERNRLPKMSFTKKIIYYGFCLVILTLIIFSLFYGKLVIPSRRNHETTFSGVSLYILISSGFIWMYHFAIQIYADNFNDDKKNNQYFKEAYNTRILGIILLVLAYLISAFSDINLDYKIDSKYKKETKIYY